MTIALENGREDSVLGALGLGSTSSKFLPNGSSSATVPVGVPNSTGTGISGGIMAQGDQDYSSAVSALSADPVTGMAGGGSSAMRYDPSNSIFSSMTGSPDAPGSGFAINPRTGQSEQVYATYGQADPDTAGPPIETGRYFASDGSLPSGAQSMAGYAPGYYNHDSMGLLEYGVLGGLAAIGGAAGGELLAGAGGEGAAVAGGTADAAGSAGAAGAGGGISMPAAIAEADPTFGGALIPAGGGVYAAPSVGAEAANAIGIPPTAAAAPDAAAAAVPPTAAAPAAAPEAANAAQGISATATPAAVGGSGDALATTAAGGVTGLTPGAPSAAALAAQTGGGAALGSGISSAANAIPAAAGSLGALSDASLMSPAAMQAINYAPAAAAAAAGMPGAAAAAPAAAAAANAATGASGGDSPAAGAPPATPQAPGASMTGIPFVDNLLNQLGNNAVALGLIGAATYGATRSQPQIPNEAQLSQLSGDAQQVAHSLITQYQSGQLNAGQQAKLDQLTQGTKNQLNNYFASIGQSDSTAHAMALAQVDQTALSLQQQMLDDMLTQGLSAIGVAQGPLASMAQYQLGQDANLRTAYGQFANSVGQLFGRTAGQPAAAANPKAMSGAPGAAPQILGADAQPDAIPAQPTM